MIPLNAERSTERHPIQVVARRTGLSQDVLRAWERRYQAVRPGRSPGSRRLYSDEDVDRLLLLRRATLGGRSIGQVALLPTESLRGLVEADDVAAALAPASPSPPRLPESRRPAVPASSENGDASAEPGEFLDASLRAIADLDVAELEGVLARAVVLVSPTRLIDELLIPLMRRIGHHWQEGQLRIVHEHVASEIVRSFLCGLVRHRYVPAAPMLVGGTLGGQQHGLGTLTAMATAVSCGWNAAWLGTELPAAEIASAAIHRRASAIALGLTFPPDDPTVHGELKELRRLAGGIAILTGGEAAVSYETTLNEIGASRVEDQCVLREFLRRIGSRASSARPA